MSKNSSIIVLPSTQQYSAPKELASCLLFAHHHGKRGCGHDWDQTKKMRINEPDISIPGNFTGVSCAEVFAVKTFIISAWTALFQSCLYI